MEGVRREGCLSVALPLDQHRDRFGERTARYLRCFEAFHVALASTHGSGWPVVGPERIDPRGCPAAGIAVLMCLSSAVATPLEVLLAEQTMKIRLQGLEYLC